MARLLYALALAMRFGGLFLPNEIGLLDPSTAAGLNSILNGASLCIPENGGELSTPAPRRGTITNGTLIMLQGLVSLLRNPEALLEHGQMILDGNKQATGVLGDFMGSIPAAVNVTEFITTDDATEDQASRRTIAPHKPRPQALPLIAAGCGNYHDLS